MVNSGTCDKGHLKLALWLNYCLLRLDVAFSKPGYTETSVILFAAVILLSNSRNFKLCYQTYATSIARVKLTPSRNLVKHSSFTKYRSDSQSSGRRLEIAKLIVHHEDLQQKQVQQVCVNFIKGKQGGYLTHKYLLLTFSCLDINTLRLLVPCQIQCTVVRKAN